MEITRRCDYACRILRSAYRHRDRFISVTEISEEEGIPYAFARTIQHDLATAGYVRTVRGSRGGLQLLVDPSDITIRDVLVALQGPVTVSTCANDPSTCPKSDECRFNMLWQTTDKMLNTLFASVTLADIFESDSSFPQSAEQKATQIAAENLESLLGRDRANAALQEHEHHCAGHVHHVHHPESIE